MCVTESQPQAVQPSDPPAPAAVPISAQNPPRRPGHDAPDWIDRLAADIRDLNPDYHAFEAVVAQMIRAALASSGAASPASPLCCTHGEDRHYTVRSCVDCKCETFPNDPPAASVGDPQKSTK